MTQQAQGGWWPIPHRPQRLTYVEPVITVRRSKAYITLEAERLLGVPDDVVLLRGADGSVAIRAAKPDDEPEHRRKLDPNRSITIATEILLPGQYVLRAQGGVFILRRVEGESLARVYTTESRRNLRARKNGRNGKDEAAEPTPRGSV